MGYNMSSYFEKQSGINYQPILLVLPTYEHWRSIKSPGSLPAIPHVDTSAGTDEVPGVTIVGITVCHT